MTKLIVNTVKSHHSNVDFKDVITANGAKQWVDMEMKRRGITKAPKGF